MKPYRLKRILKRPNKPERPPPFQHREDWQKGERAKWWDNELYKWIPTEICEDFDPDDGMVWTDDELGFGALAPTSVFPVDYPGVCPPKEYDDYLAKWMNGDFDEP